MKKYIYSALCFIFYFFALGFAVDDPKIVIAIEIDSIDQGTTLPTPYNTIDPLPFDPHGWYRHAVIMEEFFKQYHPKIVNEVGCWFGLSARHMASLLPEGGKLYAVDHWLGSSENQPGQPAWSPKLPFLYEQFLSNVIHEGLTDRIIPVRTSSIESSKFRTSHI